MSRSSGRGSQYAKKIEAITLHIAYEGAVTEKEYFEALAHYIPKRYAKLVQLIPVDKTGTNSPPRAVLTDLDNHLKLEGVKVSKDDLAYIVIDVDHYFSDTHQRATSQVIQECKQKNIEIVCSNPCFEIWLLCHYLDVSSENQDFKDEALLNNHDFLKLEFAKYKGESSWKDLINKTNDALSNIDKLNALSTNVNTLPPEGLSTQVFNIINKLNDSIRLWG